MFRSSFKIATVWGIPIKIHSSLIVIMIFYALMAARRDGSHAIPASLLLSIGLFTSIALHELGHSFVALRKGCRVREITLLFIGGAAVMDDMPRKPWDEFQMAVAGPLVSLAIGILGVTIWWHYPETYLGQRIGELGAVNFVLVAFNLLPSFPMDGGRVFRAMLTPKLGRVKATWIASRVGKAMAIAFAITGLYFSLFLLVAIAFFIYTGAENEYRLVAWQEGSGLHGTQRPPPPFDTDAAYTEPGDDEVSISPPPYKRGPGYRAPIKHEENNNPFRNLFR